jgi:hypothetical protein
MFSHVGLLPACERCFYSTQHFYNTIVSSTTNRYQVILFVCIRNRAPFTEFTLIPTAWMFLMCNPTSQLIPDCPFTGCRMEADTPLKPLHGLVAE